MNDLLVGFVVFIAFLFGVCIGVWIGSTLGDTRVCNLHFSYAVTASDSVRIMHTYKCKLEVS